MSYTVYHLHSDDSLLDSCSHFAEYLELAVAQGMQSIAFSEHGKPLSWVDKKIACDKRGLKYIHAVEIYQTEQLEPKTRDNFHKRQKDELRQQALIQNPRYEYATVYIADSRTGILDKNSLDSTLEKYSGNGWRLHSVLTNEAGKNASAIGVGGVTVGSNSTMDVTILIFERCIKLAGQ